MKRLWAIAALSATFLSLSQTAAKAASFSFFSNLNGAQEVPPTNTPAFGTATGILSGNPGSWVFNYKLDFSNLLGELRDGHIHRGAVGQNGPVIHGLDNLPLGAKSGTIVGDWRFDDPNRPLTDAFAQDLINGNLYFNLHTSTFPGGEIRGQILPTSVPEPTTAVGLALAGSAGLLLQRRRQNA